MDRFLKRPASASPCKRPALSAKQGNITAVQRACEFGSQQRSITHTVCNIVLLCAIPQLTINELYVIIV